MSKFLYPIYKLKTKSYIKWWLYHKKAGGSGILSEILQGFSFNLENTLNRKFKLFEIEGNSVQDGSPSPDNEVPILSAGDNENIFDDNENNNIWINQNGDKITTEVGSNCLKYNCSEGDTFTISAKFDVVNGSSIILIAFYDKNDNLLARNVALNNEKLTLTKTAPAQTAYMYAGHFINKPVEIKLEQGNKASGYSPYGMGSINEKITNADGTKEQTYSIFVQQPFRSIGDVRDGFVKKSDGKLYERHYFNLTDLGDYNWSPVNQNENSRTQGLFMSWSLKNIENYSSSATTIPKLLSNKYISKPNYKYQYYGRNPQNYTISTYGGEILYIQNSDFSGYTNKQVKEAMAGTILQYLRETPLDLPCTEEQIQQLENKPSTYKDFTIIQSEDETPAYLKIQYYKEG